MRHRLAPALALLGVFTLPVAAQQKASFIDGTYVLNAEGCTKLKALKHGAAESIGTVPWSVTAEGISYWEGGCGWSKVKALEAKRWALTAECGEDIDTSVESYDYTRTSPTTFSVKLTTKGASAKERKPVSYQRCDVK